MKKLIDCCIGLLFLIALLSACVLGWYFFSLNNANTQFDQLSESVHTLRSENKQEQMHKPASDAKTNTEKEISSGIAALAETNSDLAGWILIDETSVDYPVMYTPQEPERYLRRNFKGEYSISGTPFADARCNLDPQSDNLIIYGHNMKNGSMFADLILFRDKAFCDAHSQIKYYTGDSVQIFDIFAVIETQAYSENAFDCYSMVNAKDETEFNRFTTLLKKYSLYEMGVTPEYGDQLISLSTCAYHTKNGRFVIVGTSHQE